MRFTKPPLTLEEQANLLLVRGMAGDRNLMVERLAVVNYYRLSGYWYPFRTLTIHSSGHFLRDGLASLYV